MCVEGGMGWLGKAGASRLICIPTRSRDRHGPAQQKHLEALGTVTRVTWKWAEANSMTGAAQNQYSNTLPLELRRAGPEIYRTIRAESTASVRQFLQDNFSGHLGPGTSQWTDLWSMATQIDMTLSQCANDIEVLHVLGTDDRL